MFRVKFSRKAEKAYRKLPEAIMDKLELWISRVLECGIREVREKYKGYKDHPLKGERSDRRSVYLNKQWRVEYSESSADEGGLLVNLILIEEVHPHEYKK